MGDLGIVQCPPFGEDSAMPVLQWAHFGETPGSGPVQVQLASGGSPRVRQFTRVELPSGTSVRVGRMGILGVVLGTSDAGRTYRVRTARAVLRGVPSSELWPLLSSAPAPGAIDGVLAAIRTGLRTDNPARLRLLWAFEQFLATCERDGLSGATWVDVSLLPHQVAAVEQVLTSPSIRHLLTDEVGLGKTIEAIMIWSALRAQDPQLSSLIAVPRTLVPQWCFEFQRRAERKVKSGWYEGLPRIFVADTQGAHDILDAPDPGRPIVTDHAALERITDLPLDLLVIDESHLLNLKQRNAVDKLARRVKHLLLLTGTPRDARRRTGARARAKIDELSPFLWALQLVDPKIGAEEEPAAVARSLEDALEIGVVARQAMAGDAAAVTEFTARATQLLRRDSASSDVADVVRDLARRATVFERVVRTQRRHVSGDILCERRLERTRVEPRDEELGVLRDVAAITAEEAEDLVSGEERTRRHAASSWKALSALRVDSRIRAGLGTLAGTDSKLEALCDLLGEIWNDDPSKKVVIRAHYADTRRLVFEKVRSLLLDGGLRESSDEELEAWAEDDNIGPVALLQESNDSIIDLLRRFSSVSTKRSSEIERPSDIELRSTMLAQLRSFETFKGGAACLLVANDVAGTGLNLQLASDLILYDVPWRPQVTEQWIGRLDRLGRRGTNPVRIHVLSHPAAPDWELIELYESLGVFGEGFHLPPEVATEIDKLIDRADAGHIRWRQAIAEARVLLEQSDAGENDDVLLDALAPDRDIGRSLAERAFDNSTGSDALEALTRLKELGFGIEHAANGEQVVRLTMSGDQLALREVRQALRPPQGRQRPGKGRDPMAAAPFLDVDLRRLPFGTTLRPHASQFFSPQHPVVVEVRQELELNAGGRFGVFELQTPSGLESFGGSWIACVLTRTFPAAAAKAAMWESAAMGGLDDPELVRLCEIVEAGLARTLTFVFPPRAQSRGRILAMEAGRLRLTNREVGEAHVEALLRALGGARPPSQVPAGADVVIGELERSISQVVDSIAELSAYQLDREAFISHRRREVLARREKSAREWRSRIKKTGGNVGFEKKAEEEQAAVRLAEEVFDHLGVFAADQTALATEATRPRLVVGALVLLKGSR